MYFQNFKVSKIQFPRETSDFQFSKFVHDHLYTKVYDSLNRKLEADQKAETQSKDAEALNLNAVTQIASPEELLKEYVKQSVDSELRDHGVIMDDVPMDNGLVEAQTVIEAIQHPKNEKSPPGAVGQNQRVPRQRQGGKFRQGMKGSGFSGKGRGKKGKHPGTAQAR